MFSSILTGQQVRMTMSSSDHRSQQKATIDDVSWIQGHWTGKAFGQYAEEVWTAPAGGSMMGVFKLFSEEAVSFYEILIIREFEESLVLQLKHFHDNLKGWEAKDQTVDFPLLKLTKEKAFFDGLTFHRISKDEMHVYVVISEGDKEEEVKFPYYRVNE